MHTKYKIQINGFSVVFPCVGEMFLSQVIKWQSLSNFYPYNERTEHSF